ncbi:f-box domain protein [Ophiostoma piceae UAMH 11346]|uniref:F-box domain protein n=1 Tax=Ophiostoma piceae (strain UAMH 11346) TaxID=1262450 RepID=S3CB50_OPHP1|nr:f-box domain protein [Ophiostoma piceae UAMH 11346]
MAAFETIHVDLCGLIAAYLDVSDIGSLRLTSRRVAHVFSIGRFAACMRCKTIKTTVAKLTKLAKDTRAGNVGHELQHLTLMGLFTDSWAHELGVHKSAAEKEPCPRDLTPYAACCQLLREVFENLEKRKSNSGLITLALTVEVPRFKSASGQVYNAWVEQKSYFLWSWTGAARVYKFVMEALRDTSMPVGHFDLFGSIDGCGLNWTLFSSQFRETSLSGCFKSLRKLTLCLAAPSRLVFVAPKSPGTIYIPPTADLYHDINQTNRAMKVRENFRALLMLLSKNTLNLETLDLSWYSIQHEPLSPKVSAMPVIIQADKEASDKFATIRCMPKLKTFELRGLYLTEKYFLAFLETFRPEHLTLQAFRLLVGDYNSFFSFLTRSDSPVVSYSLDDLFVRGEIVHYCGVPGEPKFPCGVSLGPSTLNRHYDPRNNNSVREPIKYEYALGKSDEHQSQYNKEMYAKFGPPVFSQVPKYDFIRMVDPNGCPPGTTEDSEEEEDDDLY